MNMICKKSLLISVLIISLLIVLPGSATLYLLDGSELSRDQIPEIMVTSSNNQNSTQIQFFYDYDCQSCEQALDYIRSFEKKNPEIAITYYNLAYPKENNILFTQQKERFNTTRIHYPAVFIGNIAISGSSDIIHCTEPLATKK